MASEDNKIGLVPATLMVAGNMMGSGVFMLPANLAAIGSIAVIGWLVTIVGAIALALVFSKLTQIDPAAGGPYAYTKKAFGNYMGDTARQKAPDRSPGYGGTHQTAGTDRRSELHRSGG